MERINASRVALLGTLRRDTSPRISPIEPYFVEDQLLIGAMTWSQKTHDLRRDRRCVLHSAITEPDAGEGEFKLYGSGLQAPGALRLAAAEAWWASWPPEKAVVFCLRIEQAVFIEWDTDEGTMTVHRWSPQRGYSQGRRPYP
jgi:hypothetical protein